MAGRKPKPTKLHLLHRNPGRRPLNDAEPDPPAVKRPSPPRHLDYRGKYYWRVLVKELEPLGILARMDLQVLARFCFLYSIWRQAEDMTHEKGITVEQRATDKEGELHVLDVKIAPWVNIAEKASREPSLVCSTRSPGAARSAT